MKPAFRLCLVLLAICCFSALYQVETASAEVVFAQNPYDETYNGDILKTGNFVSFGCTLNLECGVTGQTIYSVGVWLKKEGNPKDIFLQVITDWTTYDSVATVYSKPVPAASISDSEYKLTWFYFPQGVVIGSWATGNQYFQFQFANATGTYDGINHYRGLFHANDYLAPQQWCRNGAGCASAAFYFQLENSPTEIVTEPPAPLGASSVLFLPGIQASRLYTDGVLGSEDQLWEPNTNQDVGQLAMTVDGQSVNDVYTRDVIDKIPTGASVYGQFLGFLEKQKTAQLPIKDFTAFAYDWRFSASDIVHGTKYEEDEIKSLITELLRLSNESYTNKVTIIAHSNGGLIAKLLVSALKARNIEVKIDKVIFIGTPQLGTPKAIGTILHGYDQEKLRGYLISADTAREVINNMPSAYGLLPSEKYISAISEPIVTFDNSQTTATYRDLYGTSIMSFQKYKEFLLGQSQAERTLNSLVSIPAKANNAMLDVALSDHKNKLDDWVAPAGIEVIEIIGTGIPTMKGIEYREVTEPGEGDCISVGGGPVVCTPRKLLKPYAQLTKYGDKTVLQKSASGYEGIKDVFYLNLSELEKVSSDVKYEHSNLSEVIQVQELLNAIINGASRVGINYISNSESIFSDEYDVEVIDSPVRILSTDKNGKMTGVHLINGEKKIVEEIPGSQYFEFGDTKYVVIPKSTEHTTKLYGEAYGGYGLTIASINSSDVQSVVHRFQNASVTPQMVATYTKKSDVFSPITTDINGDGVTDTETTIDGVMVRYTYADLFLAIKNLSLSKVQTKIVTDIAFLAEQAGKHKTKYPALKIVEKTLLKQLMAILETYRSKKLITNEQFKKIESIVTSILRI